MPGSLWLEELARREATAQRLSIEIALVLERQDLDIGVMREMTKLLAHFASTMDGLIYAMFNGGADETAIRRAETIGATFEQLAEMASNHLMQLRRRGRA